MSIGRLLVITESILATAAEDSRKLAALLDKDFPPWQEKCPYCGITAEVVCDRAPIDTCERALEATYG